MMRFLRNKTLQSAESLVLYERRYAFQVKGNENWGEGNLHVYLVL